MKFVEFYCELDATSFCSSSSLGGRLPIFTGPIGYVGHAARAERNMLAALSNWPHTHNPCDGYHPTPIQVVIYKPLAAPHSVQAAACPPCSLPINCSTA